MTTAQGSTKSTYLLKLTPKPNFLGLPRHPSVTVPGGALTGAFTLFIPVVMGTVTVRLTPFPLLVGSVPNIGARKASTTVVAVAPSRNTENVVAIRTNFNNIQCDRALKGCNTICVNNMLRLSPAVVTVSTNLLTNNTTTGLVK